MNNISEIQKNLTEFNDNKISKLFNKVSQELGIKSEEKEALYKILLDFTSKLIKHLDSKNPSRYSIGQLILRKSFKLGHADMSYEAHQCYNSIVTTIINSHFIGAFPPHRLNVKSQEFENLEDCEPFD